MFSYIPKSIWFPTSVDVKDVATIEELLTLCKSGEVERVIIPFTYYGYGATLIYDSNRRSIERHYRKSRFKSYGYALTMSASQFIRNEDYRELVEQLQEQYPIFDEQDYNELESETKLAHLVDKVEAVLDREDALMPNGEHWTKDAIADVLHAGDWQDNIEWWEYCEIDNDGATPYSTDEQIAELAALVKALVLKL